ncbi:SQD2 [Scenedesmus sp. PABB004]|nr:SQD2 [Scenedesmus sp. PABB004]
MQSQGLAQRGVQPLGRPLRGRRRPVVAPVAAPGGASTSGRLDYAPSPEPSLLRAELLAPGASDAPWVRPAPQTYTRPSVRESGTLRPAAEWYPAWMRYRRREDNYMFWQDKFSRCALDIPPIEKRWTVFSSLWYLVMELKFFGTPPALRFLAHLAWRRVLGAAYAAHKALVLWQAKVDAGLAARATGGRVSTFSRAMALRRLHWRNSLLGEALYLVNVAKTGRVHLLPPEKRPPQRPTMFWFARPGLAARQRRPLAPAPSPGPLRAGGGAGARVAAPERQAQPAAAGPGFTPSKVAIFVEPSPFSHISGMKNRFESLIKNLREAGDEVMVVTPDRTPPKEFCGARVVNVLGFKLPFYKSATLLLSLGLSARVLFYLLRQRPQVIHVSTPGVMCFAAVLYARLLAVPLVMSYHTHIPEYIPRYTWRGLVAPMWSIIRWCTRRADLTLVTSKAMKDELTRNKCRARSIEVWQRGVDTDVFNPRHKCAAMRARMTDGHPEAPLLVYVGRLGAEKNTEALKDILLQVPGARLALVGDGPQRAELERMFKGMPVKFMGMMSGEALSQAYASADVFVMPSETETLGFVVLEAMASGVPVVAVAAGGLTDILTQPGTTGLLYAPGDYAAAAAHVRALLADPGAAARIAAAGRREVELFGWSSATRVLREKQYARAVRLSVGKRRFWVLALRIGLARLGRALLGLVAAAWQAVVAALDYARPFRPSPPPPAAARRSRGALVRAGRAQGPLRAPVAQPCSRRGTVARVSLRPGETPEQAQERRMRESARVEERVVNVATAADWDAATAAAGDKLVVLEVESERLCQTGLEEEAELQWKADQAAAMAPCQGIKHTFARIARECTDVTFLSLNADDPDAAGLLDQLSIDVIPSVQFWRAGKLLWEHRGVNQLERDLGEGVLYFGDSAAGGVHASEHVTELHSQADLDAFVGGAEERVLTVVDVSVSSASPCIHIFPAVLALARSFKGYATFGRLMGDGGPDAAAVVARYNVVEVPTFLFFKGGREVARHVGSSRGDLIGRILQIQSEFGVAPPPPPKPAGAVPRRRR